jgi:hypothetical protein
VFVSIFLLPPQSTQQGKVHNPSGEGVSVLSSQAHAKFVKHQAHQEIDRETKVKEEGSAKRNITRKKTDQKETGNYDSRNKKQGGHGKGKWKDDGIFFDEVPVALDENDPLYDPQQGPGIILSSVEDPESRNYLEAEGKPVYGPMLTQSEFKLQVQDCLKEYFDSCDSDEVIRSIEELQCREFHSDVVKKAISLSLDKNPRERELVSRLLTCLHPAPLSDEDMESGFDTLLDSLDDLTTDVPEAPVSKTFIIFASISFSVTPLTMLSPRSLFLSDHGCQFCGPCSRRRSVATGLFVGAKQQTTGRSRCRKSYFPLVQRALHCSLGACLGSRRWSSCQ